MILKPIACLLASACLATNRQASGTDVSAPQPPGEYVVLVHGLGRTAVSMRRLEHYFKQHGYQVINASFPTTRYSVEDLANVYLDRLLRQGIKGPPVKVNFVTHSLGSIVVRQYLSNHSVSNLGRVVMIAPPNHGSEIMDHFKTNALARAVLGPAALELGTGFDAPPTRLGPIRFDCGVIAGDFAANPFFKCLLHGPNDGKVTVSSARIEGMRDFVVLYYSHT
jgi:triacylglycerol lipase